MRTLALLFAFATVSPAYAHQYWGNGQEVDKVTKQLCCGQEDCHMLPPHRIHYVPEGILIDMRGAWPAVKGPNGQELVTRRAPDEPQLIAADRETPSPDGEYWVCYWGEQVKCFFGPLKGF